MSILARMVDERFLAHRRRSTSIAGMVTGATALLLFAWRYYIDHVVSWDLFAVGLIFVLIKVTLVTWYLLKD
jgi:hypothetical protein